jgi:hypothetical protein
LWAFFDAEADAEAEDCAALLGAATALWDVLVAAPPAEAELDDDPPHAASSNASDPNPAAVPQTRGPFGLLLGITSLRFRASQR